MEQTIYDVDYFINKFSNTRDDRWCTYSFHRDGGACANGWCGVTGIVFKNNKAVGVDDTTESRGLAVVFKNLESDEVHDNPNVPTYSDIAAQINNNNDPRYQQETPKLRILAALYDIRKMLNKEPKAQASVATEDQSSTTVDKQKTIHIYHSVSVPSSIQEQSKELILS